MRDSLLRQGYRRGDAEYTRDDPKTRELESVNVFGPKCCSFRGTLDPALASRGYVIPSTTPTGAASYGLVVSNLYPVPNDLPALLAAWGHARSAEWTGERIRALLESEAFRAKVKAAGPGNRREPELRAGDVRPAHHRIAGVDIGSDLLEASAARELVIEEEENEDLSEMTGVVLSLSSTRTTLDGNPEGLGRLRTAPCPGGGQRPP